MSVTLFNQKPLPVSDEVMKSLMTAVQKEMNENAEFKAQAEKLKAQIEASALPPIPQRAPAEVSGFVDQTIKTYLGSALGIGLVAFSALPTAAAQAASDLSIESGHDGAVDKCSGLYWCIQGLVRNLTDNAVVAQFTRDLSLVNSNQGSVTTEFALKDCFTQSKLQGVISQVMNSATNWMGSLPCNFESGQWWSTQISGTATGLSQDGCTAFQGAMGSASSDCQSAATGAASFGIALGFAVAAIVAVCLCACGYVALKSLCNSSNSTPRLTVSDTEVV